MEFIDADGNIMVPKSIRPIIDFPETFLGDKKGAKKQYRYGTLHIRDYGDYYSVHVDKVDPLKSPLGHLVVDAPEYLAGAAAAIIVGRKFGSTVYSIRKNNHGKDDRTALIDAVLAGYIAGSSAARLAYNAVRMLNKRRRR